MITVKYNRAPQSDEDMGASEWARVRARYTRLAREHIAQHGRSVEVYGSAPECEDWVIVAIEPDEES